MVDIKFAYLFASSAYLLVWILLFIRTRSIRKEMLWISLFFGVSAVLSGSLWWTNDWWFPQTITGTKVGIEDFLLGFSNGGVAMSLFYLVSKLLKSDTTTSGRGKRFTVIVFIAMGLVTGFCFWVLNVSSVVSGLMGTLSVVVFVGVTQRSLVRPMFLTGFLMVVVSIPVYLLAMVVCPDFIRATWQSANLSGVDLLNIPVEDLIYYLLFGSAIGAVSFLGREKATSATKTPSKVRDRF